MRALRLSPQAAKTILDHLDGKPVIGPRLEVAREFLRSALAPKRHTPAQRRTQAVKRGKWAEKKAKRSKVMEAVAERAGFKCECGCGRWFRGMGGAAQGDHFFGRARAESVETVWRLRADCHQAKSENKPNRATWLRRFIDHAETHGYHEAAEEARKELQSTALVAEAASVSRAREGRES